VKGELSEKSGGARFLTVRETMSSAEEEKPNLHKRRKRKEGHHLASYST